MSEIELCDCHTHNLQSQYGIIALTPEDAAFIPGLFYSVGIHPWRSTGVKDEDYEKLESLASNPQVVAIGECGLDRLRGCDLNIQLDIFKRHICLSENLHKPLIIHNVRCTSEILAQRKHAHAKQPWIMHGYRGNAETAKRICDAGIMLSFGEKFAAGVPESIPPEMLLAETDMSREPINRIISAVCPCDIGLPGRNLRRILSK